MQKHQILSSVHLDHPFIKIEELKVRHPTEDRTKIYSIVHHSDWVNVVAETEDKKVILVNQWRAGINDFSIEVPGGKIDEGESPITAGIRELEEETGYTLTSESNVISLGYVDANPAIQDNKMHYVFVNNVKKTKETNFDDMELVETDAYDKEKVSVMLATGQIRHSYSVLALHKALIKG